MGQSYGLNCADRDQIQKSFDISSEIQEWSGLVDISNVCECTATNQRIKRYTSAARLEEHYRVEPTILGTGASGPVSLARGVIDNQHYAIKHFNKGKLTVKQVDNLKNEVDIHLALDHPYIARLEMVFESEGEVDLVTEYMAGGELYDRLAAKNVFSEDEAVTAVHMMLLALDYLHANQIVHRDLKLENFLFQASDSNVLKLIDFGFARRLDRIKRLTQPCGSSHYIAPEVLRRSYTEKADCWSLGIIAYMLLTGVSPFVGTEKEVLGQIKAGRAHWSPSFAKLSDHAQHFVRSLLSTDPNVRLSAQSALKHPWILSKTSSADSDASQAEFVRIDGVHSPPICNSTSSTYAEAALSVIAGSPTAEARRALQMKLLTLDVEKSGFVSKTGMMNALQAALCINASDADHVIQCLGAGSEGQVDYSALLSITSPNSEKANAEALQKTFMQFDTPSSATVAANQKSEK